MIFVLICTEGDVSEPAYIEALIREVRGQAPLSISTNVEVIPIPLSGNHGHANLVKSADKAVGKHEVGSVLESAGAKEEIDVEKWIVVDYDDMDGQGIDVEDLRRAARDAGYTLVVNKPNFEFFVLAAMIGVDTAAKVHKTNIIGEINASIRALNTSDKNDKGFSNEMLMPKYSKKRFVASKLFGLMLSYHPELIESAALLDAASGSDCYTEMPKIVRRIRELYKSQ